MTSYALQISAHAKVPHDGRTFPVAEGWQFKFFVGPGQPLPYGVSETIYTELCSDQVQAADARVRHIYFTDSPLTDYALWSLQDPRYVSGVLLVGSSVAVVDIGDIEEQAPISLSNLLALAVDELGIDVGRDEVTVYFNACR
jgi:hypothetical protein